MGNLTSLENIINKKLSSVHTAFLAKVISFKETTADIQPLQNGAPILSNTPVAVNARYKIKEENPLQAGDIVICVCCESTISTAKKGEMPSGNEPIDRFSLSNSVIVGVL